MEACSSQDKSNLISYNAMAVVIISLQAFAGLWINAFIVFVLVIALVKKKIFNSNEKILLFLGCFRFLYFCFAWAGNFVLIRHPWLFYAHPIPQLSIAIQTFLNFSNLWASSCLSVFYCIKIANFQHSFFTFLKAKIDRMVPWMLMGSVLLSLIISIVAYKNTEVVRFDNLNATCLGNYWRLTATSDTYFFPIFFLTGFGFATAFLAVSFSALLLLFSLWRHKRRMQANSVRNISVDAHIKAMKSILSFFFLYSINFTCYVLSLVFAQETDKGILLLLSVFVNAFPIVHSLVLIFSNPKLEKALLMTVLWVKCKVCGR
ncbi:taste receptor type 2 member 116-like [Phaenicophaeus curvirostris]|uniref:taste receptor type 2 member 116-like n=1 Tax=Phaenicophaeus curvirostris TaxID=33595 RepID=UPI0037F0FB43